MPFTREHRGGTIAWLAWASMLILAGCHPVPYAHSPSVPLIESGIDPQLDAQGRLLHEAYRAYVQARYRMASLLFKRFVESAARSPRLYEARWWLARSYEADGNIQTALAEYRMLAGSHMLSEVPAGSYQFHAIRRLDDFKKSNGPLDLPLSRHVILSLTHDSWHRITNLDAWIENIHRAGVTTLLIEAGRSAVGQASSQMAGVYFNTSTAPVLDDFFGRLIPMAHKRGMAIFAWLDLHRAMGLSLQPEWLSARLSRDSTSPQSTRFVDVLDPGYQQLVLRVVDDLYRTGIEGLVIQARMDPGFSGETGTTAAGMFESTFGQPATGDQNGPLFWKWAGWKVRGYLSFVGQLRERLRRNQYRVVAIALHSSAVIDPRAALKDYGEDLYETRLRGFDVFLLPGARLQNGVGVSREDEGLSGKRLMPFMNGERPLWFGTILEVSDPEMLPAAITAMLTSRGASSGPLVLMNHPAIP